MSDPSGELGLALKALLRADAGVAAAFGAAPVQVVESTLPDMKPPYVIVGEATVTPERADCLDGAEAEITFHVWSRIDREGSPFGECKAIGAAVQAAAMASQLQLASNKVVAIDPVRVGYMTDPDTITGHGVVTLRFHTEPL